MKKIMPNMDEVLEMLESGDAEDLGWCFSCGSFIDGVEPDARGYDCEECNGKRCVYGVEELLYMCAV